MKRIKVDSWSHSGGEWIHYDYFDSEELADKHIAENGYNPIYFRVGV